MLKKLLIFPLSLLAVSLFLYCLNLHISLPVWANILLELFSLPPLLLPLTDFLKPGKARRLCGRYGEIFVELYFYLFLLLAPSGLVLLAARVFSFSLSLPLLFLGAFLLYALLLTLAILHARKISVKHYSVRLQGNGARKGSCKAVLFSDLHLGYTTTKGFLQRLGEKIQQEQPDLLLFAGDLFDNELSEIRHPEEALQMLRSLRAPWGFYMCRGNHDRFGEQDPKQLAFLQDAGIRVLSEESVSLPLFTLYGRPDLKKSRRSAEDLAKIPARPLVVLDHNPKEAPLLLEEGVSLVLCGHTHNGQTFPGNLISRIESKFNYGLHRVNNGYALTTAGAGYWGIPLRLFTGNEIVSLKIEVI